MENIILDQRNNLSVINQIELLGFKADPDEIKTIEDFVAEMNVLPLSYEIVNKTIELRKAIRIKLPDAIVAATAMIHHLVLITRNTSDFKNIPSLRLLNLWELEAEL